MAQLYYQGHGSYRITAENGAVLYVDPYAGDGYDLPADLVLITHEHHDHNELSLIRQKPGCRVLRAGDMLQNGTYRVWEDGGLRIEAVQAYNKNHPKEEGVGYLIAVDGVTLYASGDTSETEQMAALAERCLDWALLPTDGVYNMDAAEASRCAALIGAKHTIPIHTVPGALFDRAVAEAFAAEGRVIVEPGETMAL